MGREQPALWCEAGRQARPWPEAAWTPKSGKRGRRDGRSPANWTTARTGIAARGCRLNQRAEVEGVTAGRTLCDELRHVAETCGDAGRIPGAARKAAAE